MFTVKACYDAFKMQFEVKLKIYLVERKSLETWDFFSIGLKYIFCRTHLNALLV